MAFPTTPLLDSFNRADGPLGAAWQADTSGDINPTIVSNQVTSSNIVGIATAYTVATYGNPQEVYVDIPTVDAAAGVWYQINLRCDGVAQANVYFMRIHPDTSTVEFRRRVGGGGSTQIIQFSAITITSGDSFGFSAIGSTLTAYQKTGGVWNSIGSTTDTGVPGTANDILGLSLNITITGKLDNFGGGQISSPTFVNTPTFARLHFNG